MLAKSARFIDWNLFKIRSVPNLHNKNAKNDSIRQRTPPPQRPLSFQHQRPCSFFYYHERTASKSHPHPRPCLRQGGWYRVRNRIRPRNYSTKLLPPDNDKTNNKQKEGLKFRLQNHGAQTQNEDRANKTCCLTATRSCPNHNGLERSSLVDRLMKWCGCSDGWWNRLPSGRWIAMWLLHLIMSPTTRSSKRPWPWVSHRL